MADISQIQFPDGTVYDIKDPVARAAAGDAGACKIFYGVCSTAAATQTKVVTIEDFELFTGALVAVKFDNVNTATAPKLNISGTGAINMYSVGTTAVLPNAWVAGETLLFVYNGTSYMVADGGIASTNGYGATKLNSSTSSTSTTEAATPSAVKSAYDLALEAKTSASDGKSLIASAITGKGVSTSATDTFATMADNIDNIQTGHTITIDGVEYENDINLSIRSELWHTYSTILPPVVGVNSYSISFVCNDVLYFLFAKSVSSTKNAPSAYKYQDGVWTQINLVIYTGGPYFVFNDTLYYASTSSGKVKLWVCNLENLTYTLVQESALNDSAYPYIINNVTSACVHNNCMYFRSTASNYITGSGSSTQALICLDINSGSTSLLAKGVPYVGNNSSNGYVFIYNNNLYYSNSQTIYKINSSSQSVVSTGKYFPKYLAYNNYRPGSSTTYQYSSSNLYEYGDALYCVGLVKDYNTQSDVFCYKFVGDLDGTGAFTKLQDLDLGLYPGFFGEFDNKLILLDDKRFLSLDKVYAID